MNGERVECVAYGGPGGKGVHAVARCCVTEGLRCQAHSGPEPGEVAECAQLTGTSRLCAVIREGDSRPQLH